MPINSLEFYLFERGLVGSYPIETLKGTTLGIDVNHYISRLLSAKKEQYLDAIGGFPTSLKMYLESDLKIFNEFDVTPVFIFNGSATINQLDYNSYFTAGAEEAAAAVSLGANSLGAAGVNSPNGTNGPNSKSNKELVLTQRHKAWTQWNNLLSNNQTTYIDQPLQPQEPFRYNTVVETKRFQSDLIRYFIQHGITYQVAPATSWIQLDYLLQNGFIDAIYGPTDCLMLPNVNKFILGMEFPNQDFRFIDKNRVLKDFQISYNEFIDISMAVGNDLQPYTLPPLQIYPSNKLFEIALDMVLTTGTNFYAYQVSNQTNNNHNNNNNNGAMSPNTGSNSQNNYVLNYQRGVASLRHMPVLQSNGRVEVHATDNMMNEIDSDDKSSTTDGSNEKRDSSSSRPNSVESTRLYPIPNDVHDFVGQRLPAEYYYYKSLGLISGKLFDAIITGIYPEEPPLDGGVSDSYRALVVKSVDMFKNKEINLLTQQINRYFQMKPIKQVKWYSSDNKVQLTNRVTPTIMEQLKHIVVKTDKNDTQFTIYKFIKLLKDNIDNLPGKFISEKPIITQRGTPANQLASSFDLLSTGFLRLLIQLELFEFDLSKKSLKPSTWGSILLNFFSNLQLNEQFYEHLFILLVFLQTKVLSLTDEIRPNIRSALSDHTLRTYPQESKYILIVSRLLTLFQIDQKPTTIYHGPVDKKTLVFREHLDFIRENLNDMFEALMVSSLTSNEFDRLSLTNSEWKLSIVQNMPFKCSLPNTVMAMMMEFFLQKYLHNGNSKSDAMALVASEFSTYKSVPNLEEQFDQSVDYLAKCSNLIKELVALRLMKQEDGAICNKAIKFARDAITQG